MKKLLVLMGLATAAFSFTGCQKNEMKDADNAFKGTSTFELVADIVQTKTTLDPDTYAVDWEEGDFIYMVTSDGTWGAPYVDDKEAETIAEFAYADAKFSTTSEIAAGEYTFKAIYASASQKSFHRGASTTHKLVAEQEQDCDAPTAHIKANDALVGTFEAEVPMAEPANITMAHLYTLMQVDVKNSTGADIEVTKFEMTAAGADLAGVFNVESFETPSISTKSGASSTITVNVANGAVKAEKSLPVYFVMAPLADYSGDVTFKVTDASGNTYTKTVTLSNVTFAAGKYNTTPYTISSADVVEPEPANVTWDLSKDETSEASASVIAWDSDYVSMNSTRASSSTTAANNYYPGTTDKTYTSTRFYKGNSLTIAPKAGYKITSVVFTATSDSYASALETSAWTNASAAATSKVVTVTPINGAKSVTATIGGTCGFTSVVVYYAENEGGEEPETKTLVSIKVENPKIVYTAGDAFVAPNVTATYDDESTATVIGATFTGYDMATAGTYTVTVSYTEGEVTATTTFDITVSTPEILVEDGAYVIAVQEEGVYYAASIDANGDRRGYVELTGYSSGEYVSHDSKIVWTITNSGAGITVSADDKYWGAIKNGVSLVTSSSASIISVAKSEKEGAYLLYANCGDDGTRYLSKNADYGFGFYAESNKDDIYLIPATFVELPTLDAPVVKAELNATKDGINVTWEPVTDAQKYVVICGENEVDVTDTKYEFTGLNSGTYSITVTALAENYNSATSETVTVTVPAAEGEPVWTLVTNASSLAAGDQIVIVAKDYNYALSTTQNKNNRGQASVTKNGNTITLGSDVQELTLEIGKESDTFAFNTGSGYLYAASSSSNYLKTETTLSANSSWSVTIATDGTATVKSQGTNTRNTMQYNPSSSIFACYSSASQNAISLYKLQ